MAMPVEVFGKHIGSVQNIIHNAESRPTNYSPHIVRDGENLGSLLHGHRIAEDPDQFELLIWKFAY
jgi:hypothetical protein